MAGGAIIAGVDKGTVCLFAFCVSKNKHFHTRANIEKS